MTILDVAAHFEQHDGREHAKGEVPAHVFQSGMSERASGDDYQEMNRKNYRAHSVIPLSI